MFNKQCSPQFVYAVEISDNIKTDGAIITALINVTLEAADIIITFLF